MQDRYRVRVFCKYENEMVYDAQNTYDNCCDGSGCNARSFQEVLEDDNYIKMQCREHKDKNKKLLFDGDIVEDALGRIYIIEPTVGTFSLQQIKLLKDGGYVEANCYSDSMFSSQYFEIIGNIYENPELLDISLCCEK